MKFGGPSTAGPGIIGGAGGRNNKNAGGGGPPNSPGLPPTAVSPFGQMGSGMGVSGPGGHYGQANRLQGPLMNGSFFGGGPGGGQGSRPGSVGPNMQHQGGGHGHGNSSLMPGECSWRVHWYVHCLSTRFIISVFQMYIIRYNSIKNNEMNSNKNRFYS